MTFENNHPVEMIKALAANSPGFFFTFRYYQYLVDSYGRNNNDISYKTFAGESIINGALDEYLSACPPDADVAMSSSVITPDGKIAFLPMLDLSTPNQSDLSVFTLSENDAKLEFQNFTFYSSGNSFHAYGDNFLKPERRLQFLGSALLLNEPRKDPIVDSRWVGHSLKKGFESLRLTANCNGKKMPTLVELNQATKEIPF